MDKGHDVIITSTYRTQEEQDDLYERGRSKPGRKVTWTKHSTHTERRAWDFTLIKDGKAVWDVKADYDVDSIADYFEVGEIAEEIGLEWGGRWEPNPDYCHVQYNIKAEVA